jgi:SDR family mycofactocin-dependent oxidoreductase
MATPEDLAETVRQVEALDRRIIARQADVRDQAALDAVVREGVDALGRLDIVVANAGIVSFGSAAEMSESIWQDMLDINLTGVWHTAKAAIPMLADGGAIILTSSIAGLYGFANIPHYVSAKHGLVGLMRTLANELGERMIRVNTIHPTEVSTDMIHNEAHYRLFCPDLEAPTREDFAEAARAIHLLPMPWVEPVDISNAVLFLASDEGRYITGVTLPVDLGMLVK